MTAAAIAIGGWVAGFVLAAGVNLLGAVIDQIGRG